MFDPHLRINQVLTEREVHDVFECQTILGIRMSKKNNLFVIMSGSAKKKVYDDVWQGNILRYNGTDINADGAGHQSLKPGKGNNNRQLYDVWTTEDEKKPQIFLFVKCEVNKCVYKGEVILVAKPTQEPRHDDPSKRIWVFPLQLIEEDPDHLPEDPAIVREAGRVSYGFEGKSQYETHTTVYRRSESIADHAKVRAAGRCDLCGKSAPFNTRDGEPYLEAHHIKWLSRGGIDTLDNVVALCPNCHRQMHVLDSPTDVAKLEDRVESYRDKRD